MIELKLSAAQPLHAGTMRLVFAHPDRDDALVKVIRPDALQARWMGWRGWLKRRARAKHLTVYLRELKEYLALRASHSSAGPIARIFGLVETDLGLGLVVERIRAEDGSLAPSLAELYLEQGLQPWMQSGMDVLFQELLRCGVVLSDTHPCNFVYGSRAGSPPAFIMVDGFGEKNVLPLCSMSARWNARNTRKLYGRLWAKLFALEPATGASPAST